MARIAGVDLPKNKRGEIGLTYIYGIGRSSARKILTDCGIDFDTKVSDWNDDQIAAIRSTIAEHYKIEGELRSSVQMNIKRLMDIGCYRGHLLDFQQCDRNPDQQSGPGYQLVFRR